MKDLAVKTRLAGFSVILALLCFLVVPLAASAQSSASSLIVKLASGLSSDEQAAVFARNGGVRTSSIAPLRLHVVEVPADQLVAVLSSYRGDPLVESVEENTTRRSEGIPSDALYIKQWALPRIGWDAVYGAVVPTGMTTVAILDTGVDGRHPDLTGKVISGVSILDGSDGTTDPSGHGTWLEGIVATNTGSLEGIAGVGYAGYAATRTSSCRPGTTMFHFKSNDRRDVGRGDAHHHLVARGQLHHPDSDARPQLRTGQGHARHHDLGRFRSAGVLQLLGCNHENHEGAGDWRRQPPGPLDDIGSLTDSLLHLTGARKRLIQQ